MTLYSFICWYSPCSLSYFLSPPVSCVVRCCPPSYVFFPSRVILRMLCCPVVILSCNFLPIIVLFLLYPMLPDDVFIHFCCSSFSSCLSSPVLLLPSLSMFRLSLFPCFSHPFVCIFPMFIPAFLLLNPSMSHGVYVLCYCSFVSCSSFCVVYPVCSMFSSSYRIPCCSLMLCYMMSAP